MKRTISLLYVLLAVLAVQAKSLVLSLADGTQVYYVLSTDDYPHMILQSDGTLTCNGEPYAWEQVESFRVSATDFSGAEGTRQGASDILVLRADHLWANGAVQVYDAEGRLVAEGQGETSLSSLPVGCYVVKQGCRTVKIYKR
ncbi:MAG: T9SS type A sorting domain-containing protein [Bacteroidales bacterium]|nr:T9SS type A sorting domain-containing protein [Bacteroidales bacterium]